MLRVANKPFMLSVIMLSVILLNPVMLSVVMLRVLVPVTDNGDFTGIRNQLRA